MDNFRACTTCAQSRTSYQLPEGFLKTLPIPRHPWSHILDSNGFNTILVIIDCFSKACKLVPLKGLPTTWEMAVTLFQQVFHNYELPEDIVSDRGPVDFSSHSAHSYK